MRFADLPRPLMLYYAKRRAVVRLADGRTARLVFIGHCGGRATVSWPSGAFTSPQLTELELQEENQ